MMMIPFFYYVGSMISGVIMNTFGFSWLMLFVAVLCLIFAPMLVILKHRTSVAEQEVLIHKLLVNNNCYYIMNINYDMCVDIHTGSN